MTYTPDPAAVPLPNDGRTWEQWEQDLDTRICMCCGVPGHYQAELERFAAEVGYVEPVYVRDGQVRDGHHRAVAAFRLGLPLTFETKAQSNERWLRDHGPIGWEERKVGDLLQHEVVRLRPVLDVLRADREVARAQLAEAVALLRRTQGIDPSERRKWLELDRAICAFLAACGGAGTVPGPLALISVLVERGVLIQAGQVWGSGEADVGRPVYSVDSTEQVKP